MTPPPEYLSTLRKILAKYGIILIVDEIQSGLGRTGKMFALKHFNTKANIITTAKFLAAGLPLSAVTGTSEIMDSVHPGGLGGIYGGNSLACRAAWVVLEVME